MVVIDDGEERRHRGEIVIWRFPLQELDNSAADTPDIRSRGGTGQLNDLRGHPVRRANHLGLLVRPSEGTGRDTKVGELDGSIFRRQDVGALDVSVDDTLIVQILQTLQDLGHVHADQVLWELAVGFADGMQRAILAIPAVSC